MDEPSDKDALNLLYCDDDEFEEAIGISVPTSDAVSEVLNLLKAPEDIQLLTSVDQLLGAADVGKGIAMREKKEPLSAKRPTTVEDSAPSSLKKESTFDTGPSKSRSVIPTVFDRMESVKGERSCMGRLKAWQDSGVTVEVRTRNQSEIRSTVQGKLIAFDKFWNLMLSNVSEVLQRRMNPREPMFTPASSSRSANLEKILAREMEVLSIVKSRGNVTLGKCRHMKNLAACFDSIKEKRAVIKREVPGLMFITGENVVLVREVSSEKAVYKIVTYINVMPDDKEKPMTNGNHNWEVSNGNTGDAVSEGLILEPYKEIRNLIQHSISIGEISLDKSVTHPTTEFDRFISVWNLVNIRYYKIPDVDLQKKCRKLNAVSQIQRNHGNCLMKSRKLGAALEAFNRAILTAEFGARSMCLALYGRSRVFQARKRYQRALDDIRYSLSWAVRHPNGNLQDDLVKKLRAAEKEYLSEVVPDAKAALNSQTNLSLKSQLQEREFPVEWSSDYLPTAARDIKAGEVLLREPVICSALNPEHLLDVCRSCLKRLTNPLQPFPCRSCSMVVFCSPECTVSQAAIDHQNLECTILPLFNIELEDIESWLRSSIPLVLRTIIHVLNSSSRESLWDFFNGANPLSLGGFLRKVLTNPISCTSEHLISVLSLSVWFVHAFDSVLPSICDRNLQQFSDVLQTLGCSNYEAVMRPELSVRAFIGGLSLGLLLSYPLTSTPMNCVEISGSNLLRDVGRVTCTVGQACNPTFAQYSRNCYPNSVFYFVSDANELVVRASRVISKGEVLSREIHNFCFWQVPRAVRNFWSKKFIGEYCTCIACDRYWPTWKRLSYLSAGIHGARAVMCSARCDVCGVHCTSHVRSVLKCIENFNAERDPPETIRGTLIKALSLITSTGCKSPCVVFQIIETALRNTCLLDGQIALMPCSSEEDDDQMYSGDLSMLLKDLLTSCANEGHQSSSSPKNA